MAISTSELRLQLAQRAAAEGLSTPRITAAHLPEIVGDRLDLFLEQGRHGDMSWLAQRREQRKSPAALWPDARSAIVFAQNYGQDMDCMARLEQRGTGVISLYALNRDYHDLFKGKLKRIAQWLHHHTQADVKVFVDTAPVMEKPLAQQAGLGWQGKHTNLVSREVGSWFFIGTLLSQLEFSPDAPETDHCGTCTACLDVCPTKAFPAPRQLDARRCISYLTIEHRGAIAREFRKPMGNRIYGCDDCLAVCPWNKFAQASHDIKLKARADLVAPPLAKLLQLDDAAFRTLFSGSPVKRTGRNRFLRNVLIAAGNSGDTSLVPQVRILLGDDSPLVRAMAVWALGALDHAQALTLRREHLMREQDADVQREWQELV
jgi:epoxyqueuosine reductase